MLKFLLLGDCKFTSQGLRLKESKLFMNTTAIDAWELDGIKIEICNIMSSICNAALNVSITLDHYKNMYANDPMILLPCLAPHYLLLAHIERRLESCISFTQGSRLFFKEGFSWERPTIASLLYLPLYTGYAWSVFRGQRSLNSEARQAFQVAVSLLSWQFPVLHNHWLSIEHYQKRDWFDQDLYMVCGLFGVLICEYDLTQTLSNLVSLGFSLLNKGKNW